MISCTLVVEILSGCFIHTAYEYKTIRYHDVGVSIVTVILLIQYYKSQIITRDPSVINDLWLVCVTVVCGIYTL